VKQRYVPVLALCITLTACAGEAVTELAPGTFKVSNERYKFEYKLDQAETEISGVLTMTGDQSGVSEGGATKTLHYLSKEDAADFRRTHGGGECPAPFFNAHAKQRILIPANKQVAAKISAVKFDDYRDSSKWKRFKVAGYCIRSAPVVELDGKAGAMPGNMFDNCLTVVANDISVSEQ
jgi:hypothetical protein